MLWLVHNPTTSQSTECNEWRGSTLAVKFALGNRRFFSFTLGLGWWKKSKLEVGKHCALLYVK